MRTAISWIEISLPGRFAIMPRPRAGDWLEDEVVHWRMAGIEIVVSLLEVAEVAELGLSAEALLCSAQGIDFRSFPIPDRGVPASRSAARAVCRQLADEIACRRSVAIHCRAGIGRSAMMAAATLVLTGLPPDAAFAAIAAARGTPVPDTDAQRSWVETIREPA